MGHREELLAGAKRCLHEKGYARTTARDIVAASGTNLASIGYHYGSKEALLNAALMQAMGEWGDELTRALATGDDPSADPMERFESAWSRVIELFTTHRPLWAANFEILAQLDHVSELRESFAAVQPAAREAMIELFQRTGGSSDDESAKLVGMFYQALLAGVMMQWFIDPENAPSGEDLAMALRAIVKNNASNAVPG